MKPFTFTGMMAPTCTPFKDDGSLNLDLIPAYAKHLKKNGVTGVWVNGTSGEGMSMTVCERKAIGEAWMKCRSDVTTVILQCGAGSVKETLELAKHAQDIGAEGVAVLPNLFDRPKTADELVDYMEEVSKVCSNTPLFYYHIPMKTAVDLSMSEFLTKGVKRIPNLSGIKFTDEDVTGEGKKCLQVADGSLTIFNGFDQKLQEALSVGFDSAVCGSFSGMASIPSQIFSLMKNCNEAEAKKVQKVLDAHMNALAKQTGGFSVAGLKAGTSMLMGIELGPTRLPVKSYTSSMKEEMKKDLKNLGCTVY